MRLFVSYARVDKPYCRQIVKTLDVHEVWYDQRLHAGQKWWDEILKQLEKCEGFVYLLSPDSARSEYCRKEFEIARSMGKHIFPVLIQARTSVPEGLQDYQFIDLTEGLTTRAVKELLNAIYIVERQAASVSSARAARAVQARQIVRVEAPVAVEAENPTAVLSEVAEALETGEFDRAVFLLKRSKESGYALRFVDLEAILHEAEQALEQQAYLREAEREYGPIAVLIKHERTRRLGCQAFMGFRRSFPNYDPENLIAYCDRVSDVAVEWCSIPAGEVRLQRESGVENCAVAGFMIGRYPVTNEQFQAFIDAPDGYCDEKWWAYSPASREWRRDHPEPLACAEGEETFPRVNVCWHEAMAYCRWLSAQTGQTIMLPTEAQWQRAAQGNDGRAFPWGSEFDPSRCNTYESRVRRTTPVSQYASGGSPYDVMDMTGNVWEWCLDTQEGALDLKSRSKRAARGGSFISTQDRARAVAYFHINPLCRYDTIGFRIVRG